MADHAAHKDYPATVHGAYLSGLREADKIVERLLATRPGAPSDLDGDARADLLLRHPSTGEVSLWLKQ